MKIETVKIKDLKHAEYNPRRLTEKQFNDIKSSLEEFGFVDPVVVNRNKERMNVIVGGHQRVKTWQKMGNKDVPVFYVDLPLEKERELNIRLNKNSGEWDWDKLANEFDAADLIDWGFELDDFEVETLAPEETEGDDDIPDEAPPITVLGDLYELGAHRVLCGDSTDICNIENVMNGGQWDVCIFDPPYDEENLYDYIPTESDKKLLVFWDFKRFALAPKKAIDAGWNPQFEFIWDCCQSWYTPNRPLQRHKACGYFCKDPYFDTEKSIIKDGKDRGVARIVKNTRGDSNYTPLDGAVHIRTVEQFPNTQQKDDHGHGKPINWIQAISEGIGGVVYYDPFLGSGSTIIVCEKTGRKCYGMELDPKYCDVIVKRYVEFCKKNGKEYSVKRNGEVCNDFG